LLLVSGYQQVLRAAQPAATDAALAGLSTLLESVRNDGRASPSIVSWLELWERELWAQKATATCGSNRRCRAEVRQELDRSKSAVEAMLGARTAALFAAGVVPLGGAEVDIGYDGVSVRPRVGLELAFPLVQVPALN
jgi:hypothetical protein